MIISKLIYHYFIVFTIKNIKLFFLVSLKMRRAKQGAKNLFKDASPQLDSKMQLRRF